MNREESHEAAAVRRQLVQLVGAHGPGLLDDARRVRAMLGDAVVGATAEANLIGLAISSGVPAKLRQGSRVSTIVAELQQTSSVQPEDAQWAVGAIAAALGIEASASPAQPSAAPSPSPASVLGDVEMPGASGPAGPDDLVISGAGVDVVVRPGSVATIGRDPGSTLVLNSTAVSRHHGRVERVPSGWQYTDVGSTQGSFVDGAAVRTTSLGGPTEVVLGQGAEAVRLRLTPGSAARPAPERARPDVAVAAPATEVPGRPGGVLAGGAPRTEVTGGDALTVTLGGTTRVVAAGGVLTVGREVDNDLVSPGSTASRHHLRIEHSGGSWRLRDLGSSSGTWLAGQRVTDTVLQGQQEFVLGDPGRGDRLTTQAPGGSAAAGRLGSGAAALRGKGPAWLVPAAVAAAVALVIGVGVVGWQATHDDSSGAVRLTTAELAEATVKLQYTDPHDPGVVHWGSGVVIDSQRGLILTNAHVAQPSAIGQGLPPYAGAAVTLQPDLPASPDELAVYVSKDGKSAAVPQFWAKPVAWDGYLDAAIVKINRVYDGDDPSTAQVAGPNDWSYLPEVPLGTSRNLSAGQRVGVWGYPADPGSKAPNFGSGRLSSPVEDSRLASKWGTMANQAIWNFQGGQILHGNSGGLVFDSQTHTMIGIPTWYVPDQDSQSPVASRIRPIDFVKPMLTAVQAGRTYVSPYAVPHPGGARIVGRFPAAGTGGGDPVSSCQDVGSGGQSYLKFQYSGFAGGGNIDAAAELYGWSGKKWVWIDSVMSSVPNRLKPSGCLAFVFQGHYRSGSYLVRVAVGGDLHVIYSKALRIPW